MLQVQRVLERMNVFLRLMHQGLAVSKSDHRQIDVGRELVVGQRVVRDDSRTTPERLSGAGMGSQWIGCPSPGRRNHVRSSAGAT